MFVFYFEDRCVVQELGVLLDAAGQFIDDGFLLVFEGVDLGEEIVGGFGLPEGH